MADWHPHDPAKPTRYQPQAGALRTLRILRDLMSDWQTVGQLAKKYRQSDKQIRRDLATIRKAGWPLKVRVQERGRRVYRV